MNSHVHEKLQLRAITAKEAEIVRTIVLMSRMQERQKDIRDKLAKIYQAKAFDDEAALTFALFHSMNIETDNMLVGKDYVESSIRAFNGIIERDPQSWLVRMLKCRLLLTLPSSLRNEQEIFDQLELLIELQKDSEYQPYYIVPYILMAEFCYSGGQRQKAEEYIRQAEKLERQPVEILSDFLGLTPIIFENKLRRSGELAVAKNIAELGRAFFPDIFLKYHGDKHAESKV